MNTKSLTIVTGTILSASVAFANAGPCNSSTSSHSDATMTKASYTAKKDIVDTAVSAGSFTILAKALTEAELVGALKGDGPFTVFAPTDEAFKKLPKGTLETLLKPENRDMLVGILTYHVVPGEYKAGKVLSSKTLTTLNGQRADIAGGDIDNATIVKTDIECSNGIIHVIDAVMMPSAKDIVATAVEAGTFRTLVAALKAAELVEVLQGKGPFTVFAPTDEAFAALPEGTVASLLKPENRDKLVSILKYHVVSGRVYSDQLSNGKVATLSGSKLTVDLHDGARINDARVAVANLDTTNGVVHVIDRVLLPR